MNYYVKKNLIQQTISSLWLTRYFLKILPKLHINVFNESF